MNVFKSYFKAVLATDGFLSNDTNISHLLFYKEKFIAVLPGKDYKFSYKCIFFLFQAKKKQLTKPCYIKSVNIRAASLLKSGEKRLKIS